PPLQSGITHHLLTSRMRARRAPATRRLGPGPPTSSGSSALQRCKPARKVRGWQFGLVAWALVPTRTGATATGRHMRTLGNGAPMGARSVSEPGDSPRASLRTGETGEDTKGYRC